MKKNKEILFFLLLILYWTKSQDIPTWEKYPEISEINVTKIDSYSVDYETGTELYLIDNKSQFYLKDNSNTLNQIIENDKDIKEIEPPLIKYESSYYFCGSNSSSAILINIKDGKIHPIDIHEESKNYKLKCLKGKDLIVLALIGTTKIFFYNLKDKEYEFIYDHSEKLFAINVFYIENYEYGYIALFKYEDKDEYYVQYFKYSYRDMQKKK